MSSSSEVPARRPALSVIIPVYNERKALQAFFDAALPIIEQVSRRRLDGSFEILFIDDGSADGTGDLLLERGRTDPRIKLVRFSRNFGKEAALAAGFRYCAGDIVIPMDVDLQDPPHLIDRMVEGWLDGADVVNCVRVSREHDSWSKRLTARLFYSFYNWLADPPIKPNTGDFRLLDRDVVDALNRLPEGSRFTKGLYSWVGYSSVDVTYERPPRSGGETKWSYSSLAELALDGIISASTKPLRVWSYIGALFGLIAIAYGAFVTVRTLIFGNEVAGYPSVIVAVLFMGGLNLMSLGILGEYIGRISQQVRARPLYVVRDALGVDVIDVPTPRRRRFAGKG